MALLSLEGVETAYGDSQVLFGLNLDVAPGQVATLLGRPPVRAAPKQAQIPT